jgi:hypothetical protein
MGGVGHMATGSEYSEEPRYGADVAFALRGAYSRCWQYEDDKQGCLEFPVDWIPVTKITSTNSAVPRSYSTLLLTPGWRGEAPFGLFVSVGIGVVRYVSSGMRLDGTAAPSERTMSVAGRFDFGPNLPLSERWGLRVGALLLFAGPPAWFEGPGGVLPAGESVEGYRFGGYGTFYIRR